jgi:hypothetical protein
MSDHDMTTGAREAIRIAEETFPADMRRQEALAKEIINAINLCEAEMAEEIIQRIQAGETRVQ